MHSIIKEFETDLDIAIEELEKENPDPVIYDEIKELFSLNKPHLCLKNQEIRSKLKQTLKLYITNSKLNNANLLLEKNISTNKLKDLKEIIEDIKIELINDPQFENLYAAYFFIQEKEEYKKNNYPLFYLQNGQKKKEKQKIIFDLLPEILKKPHEEINIKEYEYFGLTNKKIRSKKQVIEHFSEKNFNNLNFKGVIKYKTIDNAFDKLQPIFEKHYLINTKIKNEKILHQLISRYFNSSIEITNFEFYKKLNLDNEIDSIILLSEITDNDRTIFNEEINNAFNNRIKKRTKEHILKLEDLIQSAQLKEYEKKEILSSRKLRDKLKIEAIKTYTEKYEENAHETKIKDETFNIIRKGKQFPIDRYFRIRLKFVLEDLIKNKANEKNISEDIAPIFITKNDLNIYNRRINEISNSFNNLFDMFNFAMPNKYKQFLFPEKDIWSGEGSKDRAFVYLKEILQKENKYVVTKEIEDKYKLTFIKRQIYEGKTKRLNEEYVKKLLNHDNESLTNYKFLALARCNLLNIDEIKSINRNFVYDFANLKEIEKSVFEGITNSWNFERSFNFEKVGISLNLSPHMTKHYFNNAKNKIKKSIDKIYQHSPST